MTSSPKDAAALNVRFMGHRFNEAFVAAATLHRHQGRKGTDIPYVSHLLAVASIALEFGADEDEAIAALLHDAIEDAPKDLGKAWVRKSIMFDFGPRVLSIVEGCTDTDEDPKPDWKPRKEAYVSAIAHKPASVILVSASDKLHNARAILTDFRHGGAPIFDRFQRSPDPKPDAVIGYYRGLTIAFQARLATLDPPPRRLSDLINELECAVGTLEKETKITGKWPLASRE